MRVQIRSALSSSQQDSNKKDDFATPRIPRGLRVLSRRSLSSSSTSDPRSELSQLQTDAASIERWWKDPRWKHTKRIYSGACDKEESLY